MRKLFLALCLLVFSHSFSFALRPASGEDKKKLQALIDQIVSARGRIRVIEAKIQQIPAENTKGRKAYERLIASEIAGMMPHCDEAGQLALIAYDIVPTDGLGRAKMPQGDSVSRGPAGGKHVYWLLVADVNRPIAWQRPDGSAAPSTPVPGNPNGATTPDGVSRLFPQAFQSPDWLAGVLVHEETHFQQYTTPQLGDIKTPAELEVDAYNADLVFAEQLGFSEKELRRYKASVDENIIVQAKKAAIQRAEFEAAKKAGEPPPDVFATPHTTGELKEIMKRTAVLAENAAKESFLRHLEALKAMARNACVDPHFVTQGQLDELRFMPPEAYSDELSAGIPRSPCSARLYGLFIDQIYESGEHELTPERVAYLAEQVRRELRRAPSVEPPLGEPAPAPGPSPREKLLKDYQREIRHCGLEPMMASDGSFTYGFKVEGECEYYFTSQINIDEAKMAVFLARACFQGKSDEEPCNEAPAIIDQRWADPGFRAKLELETTSGPHEDCLRAVRDGLTVPFETKKLNKIAGKFWKDYRNGADRRMRESERQQRREQEDAERARRSPSEGGGSDRGGLDLTPAQKVLDRLRR